MGGGTGRFLGSWIALEDVIGFVISKRADTLFNEYMGKRVYTPEELGSIDYDAIVVGSIFVENIYRDCLENGIDLSKVLFMYRGGAAQDREEKRALAREILGDELGDLITNSWKVIDSTMLVEYDDPKIFNYRNDGIYGNDFVRLRTFELIAEEIEEKRVEGSVAEFGVFRGEFTYFLNRVFKERKCYLFDTFEGFGKKELAKEIKAGNATEAMGVAYTNTNMDVVKQKLAYTDEVEFKKGYFPDSLGGLEDRFAFVSIDVDFEDSIYAGLEYFYPRLNDGGYIMIHDYNGYLRGVKKAVRRYEADHGTLRAVPLADNCGSLVVIK